MFFFFSNTKPNVKKPPVKEELKILHLSEKAQDQIMETLKYIHGPVILICAIYYNKTVSTTKLL